MRHWEIKHGNDVENVDGPGVIGFYPTVKKNMREFVYESCSPTFNLGTSMSGYFKFVYLEGDKKGEEFNAMIDPFYLEVDQGH